MLNSLEGFILLTFQLILYLLFRMFQYNIHFRMTNGSGSISTGTLLYNNTLINSNLLVNFSLQKI